MKTILLSAAAVSLAAAAATPALANPGPEVEIEHAVARVVVIVEDRADIGVEIEQGTSGLPALRLERDGANVRIDGGLGRRFAGIRMGDSIRDCRSGPDRTRPGQGASVEVRNVGRVNLDDAPLIVIRAPRDVNIDAGGAVFGSIGRGASSVELGNGGCGDWVVANTDGPVDVSSGGSGELVIGASRSLNASMAGSGDLTAGASGRAVLDILGSGEVHTAEVSNVAVSILGSGNANITKAGHVSVQIGGSGNLVVGELNGDIAADINGSGGIRINGGRVPAATVSSRGSGDVTMLAPVGDLTAGLTGTGNLYVERVTGNLAHRTDGAGRLITGDRP